MSPDDSDQTKKAIKEKNDITEPNVDEEVVSSKKEEQSPPKSWALDESTATDGTMVMSLDLMKKKQADDDSIIDDFDTTSPVLVGVSGDLKGKVFKFNTQDNKVAKWDIGRSSKCDISINDGSVSNNHAQLVHDGKRWKLIDLMSANGTYVNDNKGLTSYLGSGDKVRFAQVEFIFKLNKKEIEPTPVATTTSSVVDPKHMPAWALALLSSVVTAAIIYFFVF